MKGKIFTVVAHESLRRYSEQDACKVNVKFAGRNGNLIAFHVHADQLGEYPLGAKFDLTLTKADASATAA